jgi:RNA polymerase sigma-70 factor (ECF subfamily)
MENEEIQDQETDARRAEEFLPLFTHQQPRLLAYLTSLLPSSDAVDDVLQDTSAVLWKEFGSFKQGTNFQAWAFTIAFNQVRAWRKKQQRDRLKFSDEFIQAVSDELVSDALHYERRLQRLQQCVQKLPNHHRELIRLRYFVGMTVEELTSAVGHSIEATYRMLSRVRHSLHECVTQSFVTDE